MEEVKRNFSIFGNAEKRETIKSIFNMLGGCNNYNLTFQGQVFYVMDNKTKGIDVETDDGYYGECTDFTLESFLNKYPFMSGDKVVVDGEDVVVSGLYWDGFEVKYKVKPSLDAECDEKLVLVDSIVRKESENISVEVSLTPNIARECDKNPFTLEDEGDGKYTIVLKEGFEIMFEHGNYKIVRKKVEYPNDYTSCCKVLDIRDDLFLLFQTSVVDEVFQTDVLSASLNHKLNMLFELMVCRDAYWRLSGNWNPRENGGTEIFQIRRHGDEVIKMSSYVSECCLEFHSAEVRDMFLENFSEIIEKCKMLI